VHYCTDRDAIPKKKNCEFFDAVRTRKKRASRGFLLGLCAKKLEMIWKQDNQTNVVDMTMRM